MIEPSSDILAGVPATLETSTNQQQHSIGNNGTNSAPMKVSNLCLVVCLFE